MCRKLPHEVSVVQWDGESSEEGTDELPQQGMKEEKLAA